MATPTTAARAARRSAVRRRFTAAGILLGLGLGGFVDGIVLHQVLQWHHMLTDYGGHATFPATTVPSLEDNTFWDGLFHASTWVFVTVGLFLLWRALSAGYRATWRSMVGLLLAGWGIFNLVEGVVDHHLLTHPPRTRRRRRPPLVGPRVPRPRRPPGHRRVRGSAAATESMIGRLRRRTDRHPGCEHCSARNRPNTWL